MGKHGGLSLFLGGDVMCGRGIDQILPRPSPPRLYEAYAASALDYVDLAEQAHGPLPRHVAPDYIWGDALAWLDGEAPALRLVNLETAVTTQDRPEPKGINYRMHPANLACLRAAHVDGAVLANNPVLDWGPAGLRETRDSLAAAGIAPVGAGPDPGVAGAPALWPLPGGGRLRLYAWAHASSGVPSSWAAGPGPGVNRLADLSPATVAALARSLAQDRQAGDLTVVSLHWGTNWGYAVPAEHCRFARSLIQEAGVDLIWGHSSHHPRPLEVFEGKLILYGCGDLLNDYEGLHGHEEFRPELVLLYFPTLDRHNGRLQRLHLVPLLLRHFRLQSATPADTHWLAERLNRECRAWGSRLAEGAHGSLRLHWQTH